ncbi:hypothetical protein VNI00_016819 [Paramarasmius palmivorus]|uniref:Uncharacterized protein n=1 Tax=Paramarasmius palmivorus TaxID=297713 RepID=A0AAW0B9F7_9AGAR
MPKAPAFTPKEPIEKLPLAVRKDVRDKYENEKEGFEKTISELLGTPFKLNLNPNEIWAYSTDSNGSAGGILAGYVNGFIYNLKRFVEKFGDEGKTHFNDAVSESELRVGVNPLGDKADYIDCAVKDGVFWILFKHDSLGCNQDYIYDAMLAAIEAVARDGLSLRAKRDIDESWEEKIDDLKEEIATITAIPDIVLDPNFEENFKALKAAQKADDRWQETFGRATFDYFESLKSQLERQGFKGDDMLQEGLQEGMPAKKFVLRILPKIGKSYNEIVIEDGTGYLQTTPENWWVNVSDAGEGLVNLL